MANIVYIGTSLDGYIADKNNGLDWLHDMPNPEGSDFGFAEFMDRVDGLVMGRNTLEIVLSFGVDWPYSKPVFVLSNTLTKVPEGYEDKVFLVNGKLSEIVSDLNSKGYKNLYIDGGKTIQSFLAEDLIDEMIITTIPTLLGGGISLFGELDKPLKFKHVSADRYLDCIVKNRYVRA
ncbi:dihydrofolate reductase family protein [Vibrio mediterranei]|uniref:dihydrofolate reductase family protein n=1 Tax=Vibrio mediterranei TaxID=689 RepID=UPI001EFEE509|nr:dihydrofolate reductase family protein [Vibrio mediterranei]MCG9626648.1 dihydrofolate reductase family protein [Vibrio mediterranei]